MSGIKPARRWQPAFYPFKREKFGRRLLAKTELLIKGPCSAAGCAVTAFFRKQHSYVRWNVPKG